MRSHSTNPKRDRTIIIEDIIPKMRSHSTNPKCDRTIIIEEIIPKRDRTSQTQNAIDRLYPHYSGKLSKISLATLAQYSS